jgi:hypothetical protein
MVHALWEGRVRITPAGGCIVQRETRRKPEDVAERKVGVREKARQAAAGVTRLRPALFER